MYPETAINPQGTALNHAACFKFTLNTYNPKTESTDVLKIYDQDKRKVIHG